MNAYLTDKIKVLSFVSIVLVLFIHSGFHIEADEMAEMSLPLFLQELIGGKIGRLAVPLFFMISGYLYFRNNDSLACNWEKQKRRIRTLFVPYLIGCLFFPVLFLSLSSVPGLSSFFNTSPESICQGLWYEVLCRIFYNSGTGSPLAFQLWFLRDLIVIVAISPLLYYLRRIDAKGYCVTLVLWALSCFFTVIVSSVFWFMAGGYFLSRIGLNSRSAYLLFGLYAVIVIVEFLLPSIQTPYSDIPVKLVGVVALWNLYDTVLGKQFVLRPNSWFGTACRYTFFIYLFHEPTLNIVRKLLVLPFGYNSLGLTFSYLISPLLFTVLFIPLGQLLRKTMPRFYSVCTGNR